MSTDEIKSEYSSMFGFVKLTLGEFSEIVKSGEDFPAQVEEAKKRLRELHKISQRLTQPRDSLS